MATPWVSATYADVVRELVVGHKDRGQWGHRRILGALLAQAVHAAATGLDPRTPLLLVPVPSRPGAGRQRGYEPMLALTREAARSVRRDRHVGVASVLRSRGVVLDQAGLDAAARRVNVAQSMRCPSHSLMRLRRRWPLAAVVICDDVVTTGATAREAQRALEMVGLPPLAIAAIAATPRR